MNTTRLDTPKMSPLPAKSSIDGPTRAEAPVGTFARTLAKMPGVLAFTLLFALFVWGSRTGWKFPKFSSRTAEAAAEKEDWCKEHNVPESICVECREGLLPRSRVYGWCEVHGVPECPEHHPDLAQVNGKPQLPKYDTAAAIAVMPRAENERSCKLHERRLQLASLDAVKKAGIDIAVVSEQFMGEYVTANGEITFDPVKTSRVSSSVSGRVWWIEKQVGQPVQENEILALVDAAEVGRAKAEFRLGLSQLEVRRKVLERLKASTGVVAEARVAEGEADVQEAQMRVLGAEQALEILGLPVDAESFRGLTPAQVAQRIRTLGLPDESPSFLMATAPSNLLPLRAPQNGSLITRNVVKGEFIETSKVLFVVADARTMWLTLHVRQEDAKRIRLKQMVRVNVGGDTKELTGEIDWISAEVDDKTRTVPVRAMLANESGQLRNNTFVSGRIAIREEANAVVVPVGAVHWDGSCHIVFARDKNFLSSDSPKVYHVRKVVTGARTDKLVELLAGVLPGEVVVTKGSAALRAELLKADLGEGCGCCAK